MTVLVFGSAPTVYHYPPSERQPDNEVTRCGKKKGSPKPRLVEGDVPSNWQPCDGCSEADDRDQRFVGTF